MPNDRIHHLIEAAARLAALIDAHAPDAGRRLGDRLRPWLRDGETLPDFGLGLELPARLIRQAGQRLRRHQHRLDEARSEEREARFHRDQTASALRRKLVEVRRLLTSALGPRRTATLLGVGKTARSSQPALLLSQAGAFLKLLRDPRRLAIPRRNRVFDPAVVAGTLEPLAVACAAACDRLDAMCQASAAALEARDRARAELERVMPCVVDGFGGWLVLIGRPDLAEKLRRILRSR